MNKLQLLHNNIQSLEKVHIIAKEFTFPVNIKLKLKLARIGRMGHERNYRIIKVINQTFYCLYLSANFIFVNVGSGSQSAGMEPYNYNAVKGYQACQHQKGHKQTTYKMQISSQLIIVIVSAYEIVHERQ